MSYKLGNTSKKRLSTCHIDLQKIIETAIEVSAIDFGIAEGHRSTERQKQLFDLGLSKIDGITKKGKHNYSPSMAFDIYAWVNGKSSYDSRYIIYLGGVINTVAKMLYDSEVIFHKVRWGGNWDVDGEIITDQGFIDIGHFELK